MDWLINSFFALLDVADLRASNPAVAAMKRARLGALGCFVAAVLFLAFFFATLPEDDASPLMLSVQLVVAKLYLAGATACAAGLAWFGWRWWHADRRPDLYFD